MQQLASKRLLNKPMYVIAASSGVRELGTEQAWEVVRSLLSVSTYEKHYTRVDAGFHISFHKRLVYPPLVNCSRFLHRVLTVQNNVLFVAYLSISTVDKTEELILIQLFRVIEDLIHTRIIHTENTYSTENVVVYAVQTVFKYLNYLSRAAQLVVFGREIEPYMMCKVTHGKFEVLGSKTDGFTAISTVMFVVNRMVYLRGVRC